MKYALCLLTFIGFLADAGAQETRSGQLASSKMNVASQVVSLSFEDLPKIVREKNENYQAAHTSVLAQEERTGHLTRSFLPQISASIGEEDFRMTSGMAGVQTNWRLGASVNLYRGGKDSIEENIRRTKVAGAKIESIRDYHLELRRARMAFWEALAFDKLLSNRRDELKQNEQNLRSARKRAGAGVTSTADANQFELYQMDLEQRIRQIERRADVARNRLAVVLGMNEHKGVILQGGFPKADVTNFRPLQAENQLDVKAQKTKEKIEELQAKQSSRWWHPEVDFYAYHGVPSLRDDLTSTIREDRETVFGVRMAFDFGQGLNDIAETKARSKEAKSSGLRAVYKARETVALDYELRNDLSLAAELLSNNERMIAEAKAFLKNTQAEYSRGIKNGPDLLAAFRQFYDLLDRSVELNREIFTGQAELENLIAKQEVP